MAQDTQVKDGIADIAANTDITLIERVATIFLFDATRAEILMMWLFLAFLVIGFILLLRAWNNDESNDIVIADLICVDGRLNESKMARFGAFMVSTWAFVYLVVTDGMTEWYFVGYMTAWVGNALFSKYMNDKHDKDMEYAPHPLANDEAGDEEAPSHGKVSRKAARQRSNG